MLGYEQINASGNTLMRVAEVLIPDSGTFDQLLTLGQGVFIHFAGLGWLA